ncbi:hypothetical protein [Phytoactinopolyspora halophila]|uniref:hypothetical protein n=1 Tax=Phytoactinopolyspora halophila TaxID=1981511 RepID=UPI000F500DFC|nr:hypothetical protein [Phytoactinopolyspora halophila]
MRVGRDVQDAFEAKILGGLKLVPGERVELLVRLDGKQPDADCLIITNGRVIALQSTDEPVTWIRRQALADDVQSWRLNRRFRSRLSITSGYGRTEVFGSNLNVFDDDLVEEHLARLVRNRAAPATSGVLRSLRAQAHWVSSAHGRAVYVIDREQIPSDTGTVIDLDMVERQLSLFDYWPSSEVHRHLAACLPMGGCHLASVTPAARQRSSTAVSQEHVSAVLRALVTVDTAKIKKSAGRESDVLSRLMAVVAHIRATSAWASTRLDDGLRIDLDAEVRQIALRSHRIAQLRMEMGDRPPERSETGRRANAVYTSSWASLDTLVAHLDERVDRLEAYRDRLRALSRELDDLADATRVAGVTEKIAQLAASTAPDESTTAELTLFPHPREAVDATSDAIAALREEVDRLSEHAHASASASSGSHPTSGPRPRAGSVPIA